MSIDPEHPAPHVVPRPGVLKALGVANIVFAVLNGFCIFSMSFFYLAASSNTPAKVDVQVDLTPSSKAPVKVEVQGKPATKPGVPMTSAFNPMMGMEDRNFLRFTLVDNGVSLLISGLLLATGIGLLNQRRWAARGSARLAWARIVSVVLLWGFYIVAVAPGFSETMARNVAAMIAQQGSARGQVPPVRELTRIYSIMNLIIAVGAILTTSIYPAISLWLLGRPGVKAAIVDKPDPEPGLS